MAYDATKPAGPAATTQSVRDNFAALEARITALESAGGGGAAVARIENLPYATTPTPARGTILINETTGAIMYWDGGWTPGTT